ncbi:hypothetical protein GIV75_30760 [Pseudomonas sp. PA-3-5D]|uniref:hypothetical protein n=6 Tax=unclassified Pseudomonas TaxID=196821 RepID=UPI001F43FD9E|nr:hypothetical protein [Pseudomonas sp. PA-3-5D]MCF5565191.1 hypothetical protein [Pseudomonas sp. PA-3-5D]
MENILHKYKQDTAYADCYIFIEQELAIGLNLIKDDLIVIKQSLFDRLSKVNPALKENRNIFIYDESIFEILLPEHALSALIPKEAIQEIKDELQHETEHFDEYHPYIFGISSRTMNYFKESLINPEADDGYYGYEFIMSLDNYIHNLIYNQKYTFKKTHKQLESTGIYKRFEEVMNTYLGLCSSHENSSVQLADLVESHIYKLYFERINKSFMESIVILDSSRYNHFEQHTRKNFNLSYIFNVYFNIANMKEKELTKFITGYYTDLPLFKNKESPSASIIIYEPKRSLKRKVPIFHEDHFEIFIRGANQLIHIIVNRQTGVPIKFDKYDLSENETLDIAGLESTIDESCLTGSNLDLLNMLTFDNENIHISTDFKFDTRTFHKIAMTHGINNAFHEHLLDRKRLYYRWH